MDLNAFSLVSKQFCSQIHQNLIHVIFSVFFPLHFVYKSVKNVSLLQMYITLNFDMLYEKDCSLGTW